MVTRFIKNSAEVRDIILDHLKRTSGQRAAAIAYCTELSLLPLRKGDILGVLPRSGHRVEYKSQLWIVGLECFYDVETSNDLKSNPANRALVARTKSALLCRPQQIHVADA